MQWVEAAALLPGVTETKFASVLHEDARTRAAVEKMLPLGRIAQPGEMAAAVLYLVSDAASYTTANWPEIPSGWL